MTSKVEGIRPAPYQLVALTKLLENKFQCILVADGVGVGKTISSAYALVYLTNKIRKPGLVVCPPSLLPKWIEELRSKFGITAFPIRSREDLQTANRESGRPGVNLSTYVMANSVLQRARFNDYPRFSVIIFDEIHNYRNRETRFFQLASKVSSLSDYRIGLSATPINNSLDDLVSELNILIPRVSWLSLQAALEEIWKSNRSKLTNALVTRFTKDKLRIHFARRKIRTRSIAYSRSYTSVVRSAILELHARRGTRPSLYEDMTYYRLAASSPRAFTKSLRLPPEDVERDSKLKALREILDDKRMSNWLIFCAFEETVDYLQEQITDWECYSMTGNTPMFDRPAIVSGFKKTPHSLLIMTEVGSEGLDFQFCNGVINYDIHWNPMRLEQRIGRVDRVGQQKSEISVYNILVAGSIDERVISVVKKKLGIIEGSVFSPGTLFGQFKQNEVSGQIFSEQVLKHELEESELLLGALELTNNLLTQDYSVLDEIDEAYCAPRKMVKAARERDELPWIGESGRSESWLEGIRQSSGDVRRVLDYYA